MNIGSNYNPADVKLKLNKQEKSEATGKSYPTRLQLGVADYSSAAWYGKRKEERSGQRRGPKPTVTDEHLLDSIRGVIASCSFHSEGYKKVHASAFGGRRQEICSEKNKSSTFISSKISKKPGGSSRGSSNNTITSGSWSVLVINHKSNKKSTPKSFPKKCLINWGLYTIQEVKKENLHLIPE